MREIGLKGSVSPQPAPYRNVPVDPISTQRVDDAIPPFPTREKCVDIANRIFGFATRKGAAAGTLVEILGETVGTFRWARNQATTIVEQTDSNVSVTSMDGKLAGTTYTNEDSDG